MDYNPLDPDVTENPYPYYAFLRREAPVYRTAQGFAAISRYGNCLTCVSASPGLRLKSDPTPADEDLLQWRAVFHRVETLSRADRFRIRSVFHPTDGDPTAKH